MGNQVNTSSLFTVIKIYIKYIFLISTALSLTIASYFLSKPDVYQATAILQSVNSENLSATLALSPLLNNITGVQGGGASSKEERALTRAKVYDGLLEFIQTENIKPLLFSDQWDKNSWIDEEPDDLDSINLFKKMLSIESKIFEEGVVYISLKWEKPPNLKHISVVLNKFIRYINKSSQKRGIIKADKNLLFLYSEIEKTNLLDSKDVLYGLIESQLRLKMLSNNSYIFEVIDEAKAPIYPIEKNIILIFIMSFMLSMIIFTVVVVNFHYIKMKGFR